MASVISENPVQGLFQGMWSGVILFLVTVANGIGIGGVSMMAVLITIAIICLIVFAVKLLGAIL